MITADTLTAYQHLQQADTLLHDADGEHAQLAHALVHQAATHLSESPEIRAQAAEETPAMLEAMREGTSRWPASAGGPLAQILASVIGQIYDAARSEVEASVSVPLENACKPWEFSTGDPPDWESPLRGVFEAGMGYTEKLLAEALNVKTYEGGDGSEDFNTDATNSLLNILTAAGVWDSDNCRPFYVAPAPAQAEVSEAEVMAASRAFQKRRGNDPDWEVEGAACWTFVAEGMRAALETFLAARASKGAGS